MERYNIIYVVCHDLGKQLGCYGANVRTPNLDHFAKNGIQFNNAFCNSPACSPSRGCVMTGQYAHTNGMMGLAHQGWALKDDKQTIVDYLNAAGYETAHFGLQHERATQEENRYQIEGSGCTDCEVAFEEAIDYLKRRAATPEGMQKKNFYLNIGTIETHASKWQSIQANKPGNRIDLYQPGAPEKADVPAFIPDVPPIRKEMAHMQASIEYLDKQIAKLFQAIQTLGFDRNTLVVFTTDHGISGERAKASLYREGVEIALLMHMPNGIGAGTEFDELIQNIDFLPTFLEAARTDIPQSVQGRSFFSLLKGESYTPHDAIFIELNYHGKYDPTRAVRSKTHYYIKHFDPDKKRYWLPEEVEQSSNYKHSYKSWYNELWPEKTDPIALEECFDSLKNPKETINFAGEEAYQVILKNMRQRLKDWMISTQDPLLHGPIPNPNQC